jgi:Tfp pilus assembly protein PilO
MKHDFKIERRAIGLGVALLLVADVALAVYGWNLAAAPQSEQDIVVLARNRDLLRADIKRAQDIRQKMPDIQKDCTKFEESLFPESTGYSAVSSELDGIASKAGLQFESLSLRQKEVKGRGLIEVDMDSNVSGNYLGVVRFLNGLQRSNNMYAVEGLTAKSEERQGAGSIIRVTVHLKTYFRSAA